MNSSKKLAAVAALALSTGLAGTGCLAGADGADEITDGQDQAAEPVSPPADAVKEKTGEATQKDCFDRSGAAFWGGCVPNFSGFGCGVDIGIGFPWFGLPCGCFHGCW